MRHKRRIYFDHDVAYICIASCKGVAVVDTDDVAKVNRYSWSLDYNGYPHAKIGRKSKRLHRWLLDIAPGVDIDHADRDKLNNRRSNLRICTRRENSRNRVRSNGTGFKGVSLHWKKWRARIEVGNKRINLGSYDTPAEAHEAYKAAALKYFGEFST